MLRVVYHYEHLDACQWSEWSDPICSKTKCGPQYYIRKRHSLKNTEHCEPKKETALCPLMNCMGKKFNLNDQKNYDS